MGNSSLQALWKLLTNLSVSEALMFGFLLLCALGGTLTAIYIGIRAVMDMRKERRLGRLRPGPHGVNRRA